MKSNKETYLLASDDDCGIYVMEVSEFIKKQRMTTAYYFHGDRFVSISVDSLNEFVKPSQMLTCKGEYREDVAGKELEDYKGEAIKAYREELPGYKRFMEESANSCPKD